MSTILGIQKFKIYKNIYINAEITNISILMKYEVLQEELNIDLIAKMVQYNNALHTHLILNHKAKSVLRSLFAFRSPKG